MLLFLLAQTIWSATFVTDGKQCVYVSLSRRSRATTASLMKNAAPIGLSIHVPKWHPPLLYGRPIAFCEEAPEVEITSEDKLSWKFITE